MGRFRGQIVAYLWDIEDWGIDVALAELQGNLGAAGVTIYLDPPPLVALRARARTALRTYRASGGLWFRPDEARYARTRLKPIISPEVRSRDPYTKLAARCGAQDFALRARIAGTYNPLAARRHPELVCKDAFNQHSEDRLCPMNPDVAAYLRALVADLSAAHALDAIEIIWPGFRPPSEVMQGVEAGVDLGAVECYLLNLCFCESCRQQAQAADVEVDAVAAIAQSLLSQFLECFHPAAGMMGELFADHPLILHYHRWRERAVAELIRSLEQVAEAPLVVDGRSVPQIEDGKPGRPDRVLVDCSEPAATGVELCIERGRALCARPDGVEMGITAAAPVVFEAQALVQSVTQAAELGVTTVSVGNLGLLPEAHLHWIKQAFRNARRTAEAL